MCETSAAEGDFAFLPTPLPTTEKAEEEALVDVRGWGATCAVPTCPVDFDGPLVEVEFDDEGPAEPDDPVVSADATAGIATNGCRSAGLRIVRYRISLFQSNPVADRSPEHAKIKWLTGLLKSAVA
jgi:hypothetical protein